MSKNLVDQNPPDEPFSAENLGVLHTITASTTITQNFFGRNVGCRNGAAV